MSTQRWSAANPSNNPFPPYFSPTQTTPSLANALQEQAEKAKIGEIFCNVRPTGTDNLFALFVPQFGEADSSLLQNGREECSPMTTKQTYSGV